MATMMRWPLMIHGHYMKVAANANEKWPNGWRKAKKSRRVFFLLLYYYFLKALPLVSWT